MKSGDTDIIDSSLDSFVYSNCLFEYCPLRQLFSFFDFEVFCTPLRLLLHKRFWSWDVENVVLFENNHPFVFQNSDCFGFDLFPDLDPDIDHDLGFDFGSGFYCPSTVVVGIVLGYDFAKIENPELIDFPYSGSDNPEIFGFGLDRSHNRVD